MKMFKALLVRAMEVKTESELTRLCADIDWNFQHEKIKADENEILYRLINRLAIA